MKIRILTQNLQQRFRRIRLRFSNLMIKKNRQRTILCNMCLGGVISHDYKMRFDSPLVNLMIPAHEYVDMIAEDNWADGEIVPVETEKNFPVGLMSGKYHLNFMHYKTFEEGLTKWRQRTVRMNRYEQYCILVETASCHYEDLQKFDKLPYQHKIALVHKDYPEIMCAQVIKGFDGQNLHGDILKFTSIWGERMYDQVNWKKFLNLL